MARTGTILLVALMLGIVAAAAWAEGPSALNATPSVGSIVFATPAENNATVTESLVKPDEVELTAKPGSLAMAYQPPVLKNSVAKSHSKSKLGAVLPALAAAGLMGGGGSGGGSGHSSRSQQDIPDTNIPTSQTPEPASMALLGLGLAGLAGYAKKRARR